MRSRLAYVFGVFLSACLHFGNSLEGQTVIAAYGFDEPSGLVAEDASGNNNDGIFEGGVSRSADGQFGQAADLNGFNGRVNLGPIDIPGNKMSITAWIKADDFGIRDARIISKAFGTGNEDHFWMISTLSSNGRNCGPLVRRPASFAFDSVLWTDGIGPVARGIPRRMECLFWNGHNGRRVCRTGDKRPEEEGHLGRRAGHFFFRPRRNVGLPSLDAETLLL